MDQNSIIKRLAKLNGIFAVKKPTGESSAKTVDRVKKTILSLLPNSEQRSFNKKFKVGHGGTLDPMASGILVIGIGSGCKELHGYLRDTIKCYKTTGRLGVEYDTYDRTGVLINEASFDGITKENIEKILKEKFTGDIMQRPPAFSALHVNGERAYDIARKRQNELITNTSKRTKSNDAPSVDTDTLKKDDIDVETNVNASITPELELPKRLVKIQNIQLTKFESPEFELEVECGSGTYIRSIVHDLGKELGSLATMWELERTKQGPFKIKDCIPIEDLSDLNKLEELLHRSQSS